MSDNRSMIMSVAISIPAGIATLAPGISPLAPASAVVLAPGRAPLDTHHSSLSTRHSPTSAVSCKSLTKEFGVNGTKTLALRGVDVDVYDGQLTLLVGPSGCGKTTLISIVAGLLNPTQGSVTVLGTDLAKLSGRRLVE